MTAETNLDMSGWMHEQLEQASPDLLRSMVQMFAEALMGAQADAICGAEFGERSPDRGTPATGTGPAPGIRGPARSTCRSPSCARERISRSGC